MGKLTVAYNYNSIITSIFKVKSFRFHISIDFSLNFDLKIFMVQKIFFHEKHPCSCS